MEPVQSGSMVQCGCNLTGSVLQCEQAFSCEINLMCPLYVHTYIIYCLCPSLPHALTPTLPLPHSLLALPHSFLLSLPPCFSNSLPPSLPRSLSLSLSLSSLTDCGCLSRKALPTAHESAHISGRFRRSLPYDTRLLYHLTRRVDRVDQLHAVTTATDTPDTADRGEYVRYGQSGVREWSFLLQYGIRYVGQLHFGRESDGCNSAP